MSSARTEGGPIPGTGFALRRVLVAAGLHLVLLEAGTVTDLEQWLDGNELLRL